MGGLLCTDARQNGSPDLRVRLHRPSKSAPPGGLLGNENSPPLVYVTESEGPLSSRPYDSASEITDSRHDEALIHEIKYLRKKLADAESKGYLQKSYLPPSPPRDRQRVAYREKSASTNPNSLPTSSTTSTTTPEKTLPPSRNVPDPVLSFVSPVAFKTKSQSPPAAPIKKYSPPQDYERKAKELHGDIFASDVSDEIVLEDGRSSGEISPLNSLHSLSHDSRSSGRLSSDTVRTRSYSEENPEESPDLVLEVAKSQYKRHRRASLSYGSQVSKLDPLGKATSRRCKSETDLGNIARILDSQGIDSQGKHEISKEHFLAINDIEEELKECTGKLSKMRRKSIDLLTQASSISRRKPRLQSGHNSNEGSPGNYRQVEETINNLMSHKQRLERKLTEAQLKLQSHFMPKPDPRMRSLEAAASFAPIVMRGESGRFEDGMDVQLISATRLSVSVGTTEDEATDDFLTKPESQADPRLAIHSEVNQCPRTPSPPATPPIAQVASRVV